MDKKAFSLIELSVVVLLIGLVTIVALNGKSLLVKANCVASSFGTKNITENLDNPTALTSNKSTAYEACVASGGSSSFSSSSGDGTCSGVNCTSCKTLLAANPGTASGVYNISPDGGTAFKVYCDMTTDGGGWTLVGITNSSATIASVNNSFNVTDNYTGSYVKRLTGLSGTEQMFDCGTTNQGVKGLIILSNGAWNWPANSTLQTTTNFTVKSSNLTWNPDLPGYDSPQSDGMWYNHVGIVHWPNIGSKSFKSTIKDSGTDINNSFTCDPQNNAFGSNQTTWFSGATGTQYVRYWLR